MSFARNTSKRKQRQLELSIKDLSLSQKTVAAKQSEIKNKLWMSDGELIPLRRKEKKDGDSEYNPLQ